ncbi:hypothetical protein, partial [Streptococcus pneumoniae]|uniref:hypothetical protein n=1 Tax=Streptococcus pneumoniae TaxID=1313 RepID=UPI001E472970
THICTQERTQRGNAGQGRATVKNLDCESINTRMRCKVLPGFFCFAKCCKSILSESLEKYSKNIIKSLQDT